MVLGTTSLHRSAIVRCNLSDVHSEDWTLRISVSGLGGAAVGFLFLAYGWWMVIVSSWLLKYSLSRKLVGHGPMEVASNRF